MASSSMAILKLATPIWRARPCRLALASAGMGSRSGMSGLGQCTSRRATKSTPRFFKLCSTERAKSSARRYSCETLVVRKMSRRGKPEARMPSPTPRSVPYFQAVSMWRYPTFSAVATISPQSPKEEVPKPMAGISAPCAESVGMGGGAMDVSARWERPLRPAFQRSIGLVRLTCHVNNKNPALAGGVFPVEESRWPSENPSCRDARLVIRRLAQHVAAAPHRLDVVLAARGVGELLAQLADEDVDDLELRLVHAAIEVVEEHFLGQGRAFAQAQEFQHLVLLAGEMHARAVHFHGLGIEIDHEIAGLDHRLGVALGAPHDGVDSRHQLVLVERLGHVVVGAEAEAAHLVLDAGEPGEDQNGRLHFGDAQGAQHLEAGHVRQIQVEQD